MNTNTSDFIKAHAGDDVRTLALRGCADSSVDMPFVLDQIAGRQTARRKLPSWAATEGIVYPPRLSMEQCSGEEAARYKAGVAARLLPRGGSFVDITGGFGVDFSFIARRFARAVYVERQERLCAIARDNLRLLGLGQAVVVCGDGAGYLQTMPRSSLIYADPARRDPDGARTFAVSDCTPDVLRLRDLLTAKADYVMIKLSPMLDWRKTADDFGPQLGELHIVSAGGECKELLLVLSSRFSGLRHVSCVSGGTVLSYDPGSDAGGSDAGAGVSLADISVGCCLFEPGPSVMKAGCFRLVEARYGVRQIERNSHLFVAGDPVPGFPGRQFRITAVTTMNKKELRKALGGVTRANIAVRNFPMQAHELRRRLRLADGGDVYIFGTTLADRTHVLLITEKIMADV